MARMWRCGVRSSQMLRLSIYNDVKDVSWSFVERKSALRRRVNKGVSCVCKCDGSGRTRWRYTYKHRYTLSHTHACTQPHWHPFQPSYTLIHNHTRTYTCIHTYTLSHLCAYTHIQTCMRPLSHATSRKIKHSIYFEDSFLSFRGWAWVNLIDMASFRKLWTFSQKLKPFVATGLTFDPIVKYFGQVSFIRALSQVIFGRWKLPGIHSETFSLFSVGHLIHYPF